MSARSRGRRSRRMLVGHGGDSPSLWTAGLDQLGPKHYVTDNGLPPMGIEKKGRDTIAVRSAKSTRGRGVTVSLPRFNLPPAPED
jgi:hypothetical protein